MLPDLLAMNREEIEACLRAQVAPPSVKPRGGYAAVPGTGPEGETCKTCRHLFRRKMSHVYLKCKLMERQWTRGTASDIKAKTPACARWEPKPDTNLTEKNNE